MNDHMDNKEETWFEKGQIRTVVFHFINVIGILGLLMLWEYLFKIVQTQL